MKKRKLVIPDSALKDIPEDERGDAVQAIKEAFSGDVDPAELGTPVERLPQGARDCPECATPLEAGPTFPLPGEGEVVQIFDCPKCDKAFMGEPLN